MFCEEKGIKEGRGWGWRDEKRFWDLRKGEDMVESFRFVMFWIHEDFHDFRQHGVEEGVKQGRERFGSRWDGRYRKCEKKRFLRTFGFGRKVKKMW